MAMARQASKQASKQSTESWIDRTAKEIIMKT